MNEDKEQTDKYEIDNVWIRACRRTKLIFPSKRDPCYYKHQSKYSSMNDKSIFLLNVEVKLQKGNDISTNNHVPNKSLRDKILSVKLLGPTFHYLQSTVRILPHRFCYHLVHISFPITKHVGIMIINKIVHP